MAADAHVGHVLAVGQRHARRHGARGRQLVVDACGRIRDHAQAIQHPGGAGQIDHRLLRALLGRQLAHVRHEGVEVVVGEAVVVFAGHHHHGAAVGLDAVADHAVPVLGLVAAHHSCGSDIGPGDAGALAIVHKLAARALGAMAVGAAARCIKIAATLDGLRIGGVGHGARLDVDVAVAPLFGQVQAAGCRGGHDHAQQHRAACSPFDPAFHGGIPLLRSNDPIAVFRRRILNSKKRFGTPPGRRAGRGR